MNRIATFLVLSGVFGSGQAFVPSNPAAVAARQYRSQHERAILTEFTKLLAIPNVATDHANIQRNAEAIAAALRQRGLSATLFSAPDSNPVVFSQTIVPGATRSIAFYAHYDGQPFQEQQWATPPFVPTLRDKTVERDGQIVRGVPEAGINPEWRLYARSAGDDKLPIMAILAALDAMRAAALKSRSNIKLVFEGEEEAGSRNLGTILSMHKRDLAADLWLICDSPTHPSRLQSIAFGAPGATQIDITVYGPRNELHGGHYGNWAPNPALMLARLLASMKDEDGTIRIAHFSDGLVPLDDTEQQAVREIPDLDAELMRDFWLGSTVGAPKKLGDLIMNPVLNVRGLSSGRVGAQASSVVPATATAALSVYTMKGMDRARVAQAIVDHVRTQGFFVTESEPGAETRVSNAKVARVTVRPGGYNGSRTPMSLPISQELIRTVESARGRLVKLPTQGGATPLEVIERELGTHTIIIPTANHDDNQHTGNENVRIQNLWDAIELMAALLTM
jgi:acetylornithine deacetylase/succinyl-diaminopimelate desuccinylase-like protein